MTTGTQPTHCEPLVSIVIACFNHGRYLGEAIESALEQTYPNIEVIIVDDGSLDDTAVVAQHYPVRVIRQTNRGLAAAGNVGIAASGGEFVMRLDADDRLDRSYVAETVEPLLRDSSIHFVYTQVRYFGAREGSYPTEPFDTDTLAERNYVHASAMMRRTSFDAVGGYRLDMRGLRCEDWDLWLAFAEQGLRGLLVDKPLLEYRQYAGPSMSSIDWRSLRGIRREWAIINRLYDHHPRLFALPLIMSRVGRLPKRLIARQVSLRFALKLALFYSAMLACNVRKVTGAERAAGESI